MFAKDIIKSQKHPNTKPLAPEESIANESYDSYSYETVLSREQDGPREIFRVLDLRKIRAVVRSFKSKTW